MKKKAREGPASGLSGVFNLVELEKSSRDSLTVQTLANGEAKPQRGS